MKTASAFLLLTFCFSALAQPQSDRQQFIRVEAPVIALTNVRVIDGTGGLASEDQTIVIRGQLKRIEE